MIEEYVKNNQGVYWVCFLSYQAYQAGCLWVLSLQIYHFYGWYQPSIHMGVVQMTMGFLNMDSKDESSPISLNQKLHKS